MSARFEDMDGLPHPWLLPAEGAEHAHCHSICGEVSSGFANLRSSLPMNLKARGPSWSRRSVLIEEMGQTYPAPHRRLQPARRGAGGGERPQEAGTAVPPHHPAGAVG
jgi:hypothetical protein